MIQKDRSAISSLHCNELLLASIQCPTLVSKMAKILTFLLLHIYNFQSRQAPLESLGILLQFFSTDTYT